MHLNGNNRLVCQVSFSTCCIVYGTAVNITGATRLGTPLWDNYSKQPCGKIVANYHIMEKSQFHYSVAYSAPVECKNWESEYRMIGNLKRIIGSFSGNRSSTRA